MSKELILCLSASIIFLASAAQALNANSQTYKNSKVGLSFSYSERFVVVDEESVGSILTRQNLSPENREYLKHLKQNGFGSQVALLVDAAHPQGVFLSISDLSSKGASLEDTIKDLERRGEKNNWEITKRNILLGGQKIEGVEIVRNSTFKELSIKAYRVFFEMRKKPYLIRFRSDPGIGDINEHRTSAYELLKQTLKTSAE